MKNTGILRIQAFGARQSSPIEGVLVTVSGNGFTAQRITDETGTAADISIEAPSCALSLQEDNTIRPYAVVDLTAAKAGFRTVRIQGVQIFAGQVTLAQPEMIPETEEGLYVANPPVVIPEHSLFTGDGGSGPDPMENCMPRVLSRVIIPKNITVHLGKPAASARNVTVSFRDYIANVASSEVYPTWPEQALRANIHCQISLALNRIYTDVRDILLPRVIAKLPEKIKAMIDDRLILHVNPTGKFVIGGPHGDTGLTGRKIIVDTYGGKGAHGGGAFSGKDPSKVDRSAAYAARHIAKNVVAAGIADEVLVQVAYAIGVARPVSLCVNTYGTSHVALSDAEIAAKLNSIFDMRPNAIERRLKLRNPIYEETAAYGHVGRAPRTIVKEFRSKYEGNKTLTVELFTWEKLDYVERLKSEFGL